MSGHVRRFSTFAVIGVLNTAVDIACFALLNAWLGMAIVPANVIAFLVAIANSYILNRAFTFSDRRRNSHFLTGWIKFLCMGLFTLALSSAIIVALSPFMPPILAKVFASSTNLLINYLGSNFLVFSEKKD